MSCQRRLVGVGTRTHLRRLDPLVLGEDVVENAALRSTLEAECAVILLAGGQTSNGLGNNS